MQWTRAILVLWLAMLTAGAGAQSACAPRTVHVLVPFPAGSPPDSFARMFAQQLAADCGAAAVVESVTGAGGTIAAQRLAKSPADGSTLAVLTEAQLLVNPTLYPLPQDPVEDLAAVTELFSSPNLLVVGPATSARSVGELVALARARPGSLTFASGGSGTTSHLAAEFFAAAAGVEWRHVPYKGLIAAAPDLLGGRVSAAFAPLAIAAQLVHDGRLRALAITSPARSAAEPQVPTMAEAGYPGVEIAGWNGLFAPPHTPAAVIAAMHRVAERTLARPDTRDWIARLGLEPIGSPPAQFAALIRAERPKWTKLVRDARITTQ